MSREVFDKRKASRKLFDRIDEAIARVINLRTSANTYERSRVQRAIREELQLAYAMGFNEGAEFSRDRALEKIEAATKTPVARADAGATGGLLAAAEIARRA